MGGPTLEPQTTGQLAAPASAGGHGSSQGESIPMRNMAHASPHPSPSPRRTHSPRHSPARHSEETTFTDQEEARAGEIMRRLKARFPEAAPIIKDIVRTCGNDEDEAAKQLMELGFESKRTPPHSRASPAHAAQANRGRQSSTTSPHRSATASGSGSTTTTPKKTTTAASPARHQSPAKPQISDAEKRRLIGKFSEEYSGLEPEVIKMALEACQFDETKARATLSRVANQWKTEGSRERSAASASSSGERRSSQRTTSPVPMGAPASLEPVALSQDRPSPSRSVGASVTTSSRYTGSKSVSSRTAASSSSSSSNRRTTTTTTAASITARPKQEHQRRAKHVTMMSEQLLNTTNDMLNHLATSSCCPPSSPSPSHSPHHSPRPSSPPRSPPTDESVSHREQGRPQGPQPVVTSQPRSQPHGASASSSAPRTGEPVRFAGSGLARGPDPGLVLGPDPGFRAGPEPGLRFGANPELCDGPDPEMFLGATMGADGPNPEYHHGNVPDLVGGSSGSAGPNPVLRCAAEFPSPMGHQDQRFLQTTI